jgi:hypothetical protein
MYNQQLYCCTIEIWSYNSILPEGVLNVVSDDGQKQGEACEIWL